MITPDRWIALRAYRHLRRFENCGPGRSRQSAHSPSTRREDKARSSRQWFHAGTPISNRDGFSWIPLEALDDLIQIARNGDDLPLVHLRRGTLNIPRSGDVTHEGALQRLARGPAIDACA